MIVGAHLEQLHVEPSVQHNNESVILYIHLDNIHMQCTESLIMVYWSRSFCVI